MVNPGIGNDDDSGFLEGPCDVIGKVTGSEPTSNGLSTGERGVLQDRSVTVRAGGDNADIVGIVDGGQDSGSEDELLPRLTDVQNVDTCIALASN